MNFLKGRIKDGIDREAHFFNSSLSVDKRLYKVDIYGSIAHCKMLAKQNIISYDESVLIINGLNDILFDIENGKLDFDYNFEDIHMFIESTLTDRIGSVAKKLHTARSRNDQVTLDLKLYLKEELFILRDLLLDLIFSILEISKEHIDTVMPGYTHLQIAQPITFSHCILAYAHKFLRDVSRLEETAKRLDFMPLGSCALAGTTYDIDRFFVANELNFSNVTENSIDSVSDRDYVIDTNYCISMISLHLSNFCEDIIIWQTNEFSFVNISNKFSTTSSIMPQKKNPDMAELIRGKSGKIFGNLMGTLTMMKSLPLTYNKDMQEDKEMVFSSLDNIKQCIKIFKEMFKTMEIRKDNMLKMAKEGFINATDVADYLTKKGLEFRNSYKIVGEMVNYLIDNFKTFEDLSIDEYKKFCEFFEDDVYEEISIKNCVKNRNSYGGTSQSAVKIQIENLYEFLYNKYGRIK